MNSPLSRRDAVKTVVIAVGGVATALSLPAKWVKPVVESIVAPAHAALSLPATTTTGTVRISV